MQQWPSDRQPGGGGRIGLAEPMRAGPSSANPFATPDYSLGTTPEGRRGPLGWWLNLTAPSAALARGADRATRERVRRAELTSVVALFVMILPVLLGQQALVDPVTAAAMISVEVVALVALVLNRLGQQAWAAVLLVLGMDIVIEGSLVTARGGLSAAWLPTFDLFVVSIIAVGILLSPRYIWVFTAFHIGLILGDYYLLQHAPDLAPLIKEWGEGVAYQRALMLQLIGAVLGFVAARSVDLAIRRADRAEEIAALEHTLAEQKRQLDVGIQQLLQTHVRAANGDFSARAPLGQDNVLWQIASSLNNLLSRLQRSGQAEHQLRRTEEELHRLAAAIDDAQAGRPPLWPAPTGTAADLIIERIARGSGRRGSRPISREPGQPSGQMGQIGGSMQTPTTQGWPSQNSAPIGQAPAGQGWPSQNSAPIGQPQQSFQGPDYRQQPQSQQRAPEAPAVNPWAFPQDPDETRSTTE